MNTNIHTYMNTHLHKYLRRYTRTCIHINIHTYVYTYIHTYIHTCIYPYIHTYIHIYIHPNFASQKRGARVSYFVGAVYPLLGSCIAFSKALCVACAGYIMEAQKDDSKSSTLFILAQTDVKGLIPKVSE